HIQQRKASGAIATVRTCSFGVGLAEDHAFAMRTGLDEARRLPSFAPDVLIGTSERITEIRGWIEQAAHETRDVLLHGEPGTGKELVARMLHELGERRGPFIRIDARSPAAVVDDKLFSPKGKDSTVYLHSADDLPVRTQAKLVEALRERDRPSG